jgi:hypothetical protein
MSLANRLSAVIPARSNRGCRTCAYLKDLSPKDLEAWNEWIAAKRSITQLWEVATADPDNPLEVSITGLRHHIRAHCAS